MKREIVNMGASVRERQRQRAGQDGANVEIHLVRYAYERLLHRLGQSEHKDCFVLPHHCRADNRSVLDEGT